MPLGAAKPSGKRGFQVPAPVIRRARRQEFADYGVASGAMKDIAVKVLTVGQFGPSNHAAFSEPGLTESLTAMKNGHHLADFVPRILDDGEGSVLCRRFEAKPGE